MFMSRILTFVFAITLRACLAHTSQVDVTWCRDRRLDNFIKITGYPYQEIAGRTSSIIQCAFLCSSDSLCSSFFFIPLTGRCFLNEFVFVKPDGGQPSPGAIYFKGVSDDCPSHDGYVWLRGSRLCIKVYPSPLSFHDAYRNCASDGSWPVVLDTATKYKTVLAYAADGNTRFKDAYIGAVRDGVLNSTRTSWNSPLHPLYWLNGNKV